MIDVELYGEVRRCRVDGLSQREAARRLGISRNTVAKYWDGGHIPGEQGRAARAEAPGKAAVKEAMRDYCERNKDKQQRKHKINAKTLWRDLRYEYPRSEATYRRYFAELRGERQVRTRLPLSFGIGEMAEADWKQATVRLRGKEIVLHVLCVNLMYAYTPFKKAYPDERRHNLIDGLVSAIDFYMGSPRKILVDNMVAARKKGYGKHAQLTDEFKLFCAHYGIEMLFCAPRDAAGKGGAKSSGFLNPQDLLAHA
ncbi:MAG: hypothetical protein FWH26_11270 [Oscillospiraceae bacterium]|nr:hypothetical protein [Oscillospiraceae bacterium]